MNQVPLRLAMWSGPRNLSTAMMYSFASRTDTFAIDEPFYAAYLNETGITHPMNAAVIAAGEIDYNKVADYCITAKPQQKAIFYQKQMTQHMVESFNLDWVAELSNIFLIRDPAKVIASYQTKNGDPSVEDIGVKEQWHIFKRLCDLTGTQPLVVDSADILAAPELMLKTLCSAIGIEFQASMLSWKAGPKSYDGVWAPHWYQSVWKTSGFGISGRKTPVLPDHLLPVLEAANQYYEQLKSYKLKPAS